MIEKIKKIGFWLWLPVRLCCWIIVFILRFILTGIVFIGWGCGAARDIWDDIPLW